MTKIKTDLYLGDCLAVLADFDPDSFDLIMTSPPYAGAGTTCQVAQTLFRNSAGIEILPQYYQLVTSSTRSLFGG
jgi:DNA modification methylase